MHPPIPTPTPTSTRRRRGLKAAVAGLGLLSLLGVAGISAAAESNATPTATTADLAQLRDTIFSKLEAANLKGLGSFGVFLDPSAGRVLVQVATEANTTALRKLVEGVIGKDAILEVVHGTAGPQVDDRAGIPLEEGCTAGFAINTDNNNGGNDDGFLTAGHCFDGRKFATTQRFSLNGKTVQGKEFSFSGDNGGVTDYGIVDLISSDDVALPEILDGAPVLGFEANVKKGLGICKTGRTTGTTCGTIGGVDGVIHYGAVTRRENGMIVTIHKAAKVTEVIESDLCSEPGDSGAPVYSVVGFAGVNAVGINSGGMTNLDANGIPRCMSKFGGRNVAWHTTMSTNPFTHIPVHSTDLNAPYTLKIGQ